MSRNFSKTHTVAILFNYRQKSVQTLNELPFSEKKKKIFEWAFSNK